MLIPKILIQSLCDFDNSLQRHGQKLFQTNLLLKSIVKRVFIRNSKQLRMPQEIVAFQRPH
jgi:hypothetical protein